MKNFDFYLSEKDQYVPESYIPLTDLLLDSKYALPGYSAEEWAVGFKALDEMRKKTFRNVKKRFNLAGVKNFANFWNGNLDAINEAGLNEFYKLSALGELSSVIIAFEHKKISEKSRRNNRIVSFGILRSNYDKYAESLQAAIRQGKMMDSIILYDVHKKRTNDLFNSSKAVITIDGQDRKSQYKIQINKTDLYLEFERWCKLKGKTKKQGIYEAIKLLMEQNPLDKDDTQDVLTRQSGFNSLECVIQTRDKGEVTTSIKLPASIYDTANAVVRRFNSDPANISKHRLTLHTMASQALLEYIKRMPLKYVDPVAFREYASLVLDKEYNERKQGGNNAE